MSVRRVGAVMSSYPTLRKFVSRGNAARASRVRASHFSHAALPDSDRSGEASRASAVARAITNSSGTTVVDASVDNANGSLPPTSLRGALPASRLPPSVSVRTRSPLSIPHRCEGSVRHTTESASIGDGDEVDTLTCTFQIASMPAGIGKRVGTVARLQRLVLDRLVDMARRLADGLVDVVVYDLRRVLRGPQLVRVVSRRCLGQRSRPAQLSVSRVVVGDATNLARFRDDPPAVVVVVPAEQGVVDETRLIACRSGRGYNEAVPDQVSPDALTELLACPSLSACHVRSPFSMVACRFKSVRSP